MSFFEAGSRLAFSIEIEGGAVNIAEMEQEELISLCSSANLLKAKKKLCEPIP
jgi:hypothetical protein